MMGRFINTIFYPALSCFQSFEKGLFGFIVRRDIKPNVCLKIKISRETASIQIYVFIFSFTL